MQLQLRVLLALILLLPLSSASSSSLATDIQSLLLFKNSSDPFNHLHSWSSNSSPCSSSPPWLGISCSSTPSGPRVTHLILHNLSLSGPTLPLLLPLSSLRLLSLKSNSLSGPIPTALPSSLPSLRLLFLSHNLLSGPVPSSLLLHPRLYRLDLSSNHLSSPTTTPPPPTTTTTRLLTLLLNSNNLTGNLSSLPIPTNLQDLNLSSNSLSGPIPRALSLFPASSFANNPSLCGPPLPAICRTAEASSAVDVAKPSNNRDGGGGGGGGGISRMAVIAIVAGDFVILVIVSGLVFCYFWRKFAGRRMRESEKIVYSTPAATAGPMRMAAMTSGGGFESRGKMVFLEESASASARRRFELEDLLRASAEMLGKGGYGTAYKAVLDDGNVVAVKRLREVGDGAVVTRREFEAQMDVIGRLRHGNLVGLKAYYYARDEKLLVYEYMAGGSLFALLHGQWHFRD